MEHISGTEVKYSLLSEEQQNHALDQIYYDFSDKEFSGDQEGIDEIYRFFIINAWEVDVEAI